jgi:hypothetical protein
MSGRCNDEGPLKSRGASPAQLKRERKKQAQKAFNERLSEELGFLTTEAFRKHHKHVALWSPDGWTFININTALGERK